MNITKNIKEIPFKINETVKVMNTIFKWSD